MNPNPLSEEEAIEVIRRHLARASPGGVILTHPEDAHDLPLPEGRGWIIVSTDGNTEKYSRYPWEPLSDWGWRSLVAALSDLVAKGTRPLAFTLDLGVAPSMGAGELEQIARGVGEASTAHGVAFLGGDLNRSVEGGAWISVTALGVSQMPPPTRRGGREGEGIYTTLVNGYGLSGAVRLAYYHVVGGDSVLKELLRGRRWRPRAPLGFVELVGEIPVSSSTDSSDGLLRSLLNLSRSSGLTVCLHKLPHPTSVPEGLLKLLPSSYGGLTLGEFIVLEGGEEFEVVFSTSVEEELVYKKCSNKGLKCMKIGEYCKPGGGRVIYGDIILSEGGWDNLRSTL